MSYDDPFEPPRPATAEECALWLDRKYSRHGEIEDQEAAQHLRRLTAELTALRERVGELTTMVEQYASECAECEGSGETGITHDDGTQSSTSNPPCPACTDIRALLKPSAPRGEVSTLCAVCDQIKELHPNTHPWTPKGQRGEAKDG